MSEREMEMFPAPGTLQCCCRFYAGKKISLCTSREREIETIMGLYFMGCTYNSTVAYTLVSQVSV